MDGRVRVVLLDQAIQLCASLGSLLRQIGPSRFTHCSNGEEDGGILGEVHQREDVLRQRLQKLDEARNEALAPVSRVSDDILRLVFCAHDYDPPHNLDLSLNASRVCRRWRAVVLDTATSWAYVRFIPARRLPVHDQEPFHPWYDTKRKGTIQNRDAELLLRSKSCFLSADLHISDKPESEAVLAQFLTSCQERVADLSVHLYSFGPGSFVLSGLVPCLDSNRSVLRKLALHHRRPSPTDDAVADMEDILGINMPNLQEVTLSGMSSPSYEDSKFVAFASCRKLEIMEWRGLNSSRFVALLKCCPELVSLKLRISYVTDEVLSTVGGPRDRLLLNKLRSYEVNTYGVYDFIFCLLLAPRLNHLGLDSFADAESGERLGDAVSDFIRSSSMSLESLQVENVTPTFLQRILEDTPQLLTLSYRLSHAAFSDDREREETLPHLLNTMCPSLEDPNLSLCPCLTELVWRDEGLPRRLLPLIEFIQRRKAYGMPIHRLEIAAWPEHWTALEQSGMPASPEEAYELERELGKEVDEFVVGDWLFDKGKGLWVQSDKASLPTQYLLR